AGIAASFERDGERVRVVLPPAATRAAVRPASVTLPRVAGGFVGIEDAASHLGVRFALHGANQAPLSVADGIALYAGALETGRRADAVQRVRAEGTEDVVVFEERPARQELLYEPDVSSHVAGLRLVSNTLEFVDEDGAPRLRVAPPIVIDAHGEPHDAKLDVE